MKLLLDEMYSPEIARRLQAEKHEVQSIQGDRPELKTTDDEEIVEPMSSEQRGVVTNNVKHFMPIHKAWIAAGRVHYGFLFSADKSMPRSLNAIGLWVETLEDFLSGHTDEGALKNRTYFLTPRR